METGASMSSLGAVLILAGFLFLAIVGGIAGILIERRRAQGDAWQNPAVRDALMPVAGWLSLAALYGALVALGTHELSVLIRNALATLALLLYIYAALATLRLIYLSARRIVARIAAPDAPLAFRPLPLLGRLRFPTLFVAALLTAAAVFWFDGVSANLVFVVGVLTLLAVLRKPQA
jgi:hypothetical protein